MQGRPEVSVIVTVYNREEYLAECLKSIAASTYQDFEVVLVDDGSSDASLEIAWQFAEGDDRIRVFRNDINLGDYPNRMYAAKLAQGRYLKYVDSDDLIYSHGLAVMVEAMRRHPDAALGLAHSLAEDDEPYPWRLEPSEVYRKQFLGRGCLSCGPTGSIIRSDAFAEVGGFRSNWRVLSDIDLWYRLAARWPTVLLPPGLVWWRRHGDQEYSKGGANHDYLHLGYALNKQTLSDPVTPLSAEQRRRAGIRNRQHFARRLLSLASRGRQPNCAFGLWRRSDLGFADLLKGFRRYR